MKDNFYKVKSMAQEFKNLVTVMFLKVISSMG